MEECTRRTYGTKSLRNGGSGMEAQEWRLGGEEHTERRTRTEGRHRLYGSSITPLWIDHPTLPTL